MKTLLISSLALAILTGAALAQAAEAPPPPGAPPPAGMKAPPPPPPPPGGPDAMNDEGPGGPAGPPPPPPSKAAHFHMENGNLTLDVKCADDDATKACADSVLQLLEKLQAAPKP
jgi:hypothetical protein